MILPVLAAFLTIGASDVEISRHGLQVSDGAHLVENFDKALFTRGGFTGAITGSTMLLNSFILGIGFAVGKIIFGMMAAYAIVYFRLRFATFAFWVIFTTLLLPLEVRILPTYEVVHGMGLINTYTGLILPLVASATATFFFRQFFLSIPEELVEAARMDGAGPVKFFFD
ncbi:MAG: ABC transporter permease subunit, partial [Hoeflea sp.]|nr:ABC transporter permease subunit [Hoeflea sp.]